MNILLIEPDRLLARTYATALKSAGHEVRISTTAQQAVLAADAQTPDLVLLELQLVSHSGIEFLYEFRSYPEWQEIPVIIHSLVPPTEFLSNRRLLKDELGVVDYVYKPQTTLVRLLKTVQKTITPTPTVIPAEAGIQ
jgi:DNA-binding response OmpR family regulator